jgi:hypothetical protein
MTTWGVLNAKSFSWRSGRDAYRTGVPLKRDGLYALDAIDQHAASWCGCCYIVSTVQAIDDRIFIQIARGPTGVDVTRAGRKLSISLQSVMDHFQEWNDSSELGWNVCHGGSVTHVLQCIMEGRCPLHKKRKGEHNEGSDLIGYSRRRENCDTPNTGFSVLSYRRILNEEVKKDIVDRGPVILEMSAQTAKSVDRKGVVKDNSLKQPNHSVSVVGWERVQGEEFWVVRNSWGKNRAPRNIPTDYMFCVGVGRNTCVNHWEAWKGIPSDPGFFLLPVSHPSLYADISPWISVEIGDATHT